MRSCVAGAWGLVASSLLLAKPVSAQSPVPSAAAANPPPAGASLAPTQAPVAVGGDPASGARFLTSEPLPDVLPYDPGQPIPQGYELQNHIRLGFVIAGAITGGIGYTLSAAVGLSDVETDFQRRWLLLPVLGPFIGMATIKETCSRDAPTLCSKSTSTVDALAFLGTMQLVGGALFAYGELSRTPRLVLKQEYALRVVPTSMGQSGYGLAAIGTW